ncbi:MAG: ABC transporter ATP-binding protein [Pseudomonadota bacterium]
MYGEYGYIEEGRLGKPYNIRLLKRLALYAYPYKKIISLALSLTVLITLLDLAIPYLSKIAIDRYILSSWVMVNIKGVRENRLHDFLRKYEALWDISEDGAFGLIPNTKIQKMDPRVLYEYRQRGILSQKRFYKVSPSAADLSGLIPREKRVLKMRDGSIVIPVEILSQLTIRQILDIRTQDISGLAMVTLVLLAIIVVSFTLGYGEYYLLERTGQNIMQDIRLRLFAHIQNQSVRFFDRNPLGRLVTRVTNDIENLNEMFKSVIITVFKDIFLLAGILAVLLYLNWRLAMVSFIILPFIFGLTLLFSTMAREVFRELREKVAKLNTFLQERLSGMRIIQLFVREEHQMEAFSRINRENYLAGMKQIQVFAVFMPVMELLSSCAVALIIWYGGGEVIREQLTLGSLVAFISYIQMFFKPIRDISEKYNIMQSAMASTERIFEFMDQENEIPEPDRPIRLHRVEGHVRFDGVGFGYDKTHPVLNDISFEVSPGDVVAIVGATGAGKTTIVNLLERFYDPDRGTIFLDGVDIRKLAKGELRSHIGLVMQDIFLFSGTLMDNIVLGKDGRDMGRIHQAARQANVHLFMGKWPDALQQEIGEGGLTLSAGQRQLLSFARALAYDPKVLILDEATSSVDPETESLVQEAISKITKRRTTILIAHRLSTIQKADRIMVMHHGCICEQGTHQELMALEGLYYKLNRLREPCRYNNAS